MATPAPDDAFGAFLRPIKSIPLGVKLFLAINIAIYVLEILWAPLTTAVCLLPHQMLPHPLDMYRIFTAPFFHLGFLHLLFNMLALYSLGSALERTLGTSHFILFVLGTGFLAGLLSPLLYTLLHRAFSSMECSVGFSGIIFAMVSYQSMSSSIASYNFWGFVIPAKLYPWVLLLFTQLFMPGVSLLVHVCGILAGYSWYFSIEKFGTAYIALIESKFDYCFPKVTEWASSWKSSPEYSLLPTTAPETQSTAPVASSASSSSPMFPGKGYRLGEGDTA